MTQFDQKNYNENLQRLVSFNNAILNVARAFATVSSKGFRINFIDTALIVSPKTAIFKILNVDPIEDTLGVTVDTQKKHFEKLINQSTIVDAIQSVKYLLAEKWVYTRPNGKQDVYLKPKAAEEIQEFFEVEISTIRLSNEALIKIKNEHTYGTQPKSLFD